MSISIAKISISPIRLRIDITDPSHIAVWDYLSVAFPEPPSLLPTV